MLTITRGDIFNSEDQVIVNPVNRVGVMGAGLAKKFALRYPEILAGYRESCKSGSILNGGLYIHRVNALNNPEYVLCFPTKNHWSEKSDISLIRNGLEQVKLLSVTLGLMSFSFPALGCGLGGLSWEKDVFPIIKELLYSTGFSSTVYLE